MGEEEKGILGGRLKKKLCTHKQSNQHYLYNTPNWTFMLWS